MIIGEKLLNMPRDWDEAMIIHTWFHIIAPNDKKDAEFNARRLVEMNNEVYQQLHPSCESCGAQLNVQNICMDCAERQHELIHRG